MIFTQHAIERYRSRHAPHMSFVAARRYLESMASTAVPLRQHTRGGQERYLLPESDCLLVVKRDRLRCGSQAVCVTVLPADARTADCNNTDQQETE